MKAKIERDFFRGGVRIWVATPQGQSVGYLKATLDWVTVPRDVAPPEDACIFLKDDLLFDGLARVIIDAAVDANLMPDPGKLAGELAATKEHLADMKVLALSAVKSATGLVDRFLTEIVK